MEDKPKLNLSRRRFLQWSALTGSAVLLNTELAAAQGNLIKDIGPLVELGTNLEMPLELMANSFITPNKFFFVRNNAPTPVFDVGNYKLVVEGDAVERTIELSYEDLLRLPSQSQLANIECGGNWRSFFDTVVGTPARGGQWGTGAIGLAFWTGVQLNEVLKLAGVKDNAVDVNLIGMDSDAPEGDVWGGFNRPMPIEKAMLPNTLLAYSMNGEPLPFDHGFPVRGVVPGWVGSNNIKWLGRIFVSSEKVWVRNNTTSYVLVGNAFFPPIDAPEGALGEPVTIQTIKSALAIPRPGQVSAGSNILRGFARSPLDKIVRVEWRVDDGDWQEARLIDPIMDGVWTRFEFEWEATPGEHTIITKATDAVGRFQPEHVTFNEKGYLLNIQLPHPVEVS